MNDKDVDDMIEQAARDHEAESMEVARTAKHPRLAKLRQCVRSHPKKTAAIAVVILTALLLAIPPTRYMIAGIFVSRDLAVEVIDSDTNQPVSDARVLLRGQEQYTNADGIALFTSQKPGNASIEVSKNHYSTASTKTVIRIPSQTYAHTVSFQATGRQVPVRVTNKISGQSIAGATIVTSDTRTTTDTEGNAELVLDAALGEVTAQVAADGYITTDVDITASEDVTANTIALTPAGKVYVLSKQSGRLDVVKLNLDGSEREVVVKATGTEEVANTYLVPSSDWKFVVLHARRDSNQAALYLLDTTTDKLTEIDTTSALFNVVGWYGSELVYTLQQTDLRDWQPGRQQIKQFDAGTGQTTTIDSTSAMGNSYENYRAEYYTNIHVLSSQTVVFAKQWSGTAPDAAREQNALYAFDMQAGTKQTVREFGSSFGTTVQPTPDTIWLSVSSQQRTTYYAFENNRLEESPNIQQAKFVAPTPRFFLTPNQSAAVWSEQVDGTFTTYIADTNLTNKSSRLSRSNWQAYGWYGDDYILLSQFDSELAVMHKSNPADIASPQKITNYHRPPQRGPLF
jgi:hypothetical protein